RPMLAVGNEVSGTTTLWDITGDGVPGGGTDPSEHPTDDGAGALPKTGTGATGLLLGLAAALSVGGGVLVAMRRRAA
ncbi:MAG: LPXTG cell wall anchor domain-containing protein, partial [Glycomyces artemisiae]|nr:LPXTG cell wall anchor domain-containing protein [Glycomyces artemisiae]